MAWLFNKKGNSNQNDWEWIKLLREESKSLLTEILEKTKFHRAAYTSAKDIKIAQLWSAIIELKREIEDLRHEIRNSLEPFKKIIEYGEEEKRKAIEKILTSLIKETEEKEKKVKEITESLMKL